MVSDYKRQKSQVSGFCDSCNPMACVAIGVEEWPKYLGYLCVYDNTPPQFHMAKPNGIGKNRKRHVETRKNKRSKMQNPRHPIIHW